MQGVIDLADWRRRHDHGEHDRLAAAVDRLDAELSRRGWEEPPAWVLTELLAVQGCLSLGLPDEAAWRIEKLVQRTERIRERAPAR